MTLVFVNIMQELHRLDSTSYITQPPVPLAVLEREIDQLEEFDPTAFLQFTDDNLLVDREYAMALLGLVRQKQRRFVIMVTADQFCDITLLEEMASAGCLGVHYQHDHSTPMQLQHWALRSMIELGDMRPPAVANVVLLAQPKCLRDSAFAARRTGQSSQSSGTEEPRLR